MATEVNDRQRYQPRPTLQEMRQIIIDGGSVLYEGRMLTRLEHLPTAADIAVGDPEAEARTSEDIDVEIARLKAEKAKLGRAEAAHAPTAPPKDDGKQGDKKDDGPKK